MAARAFAIDPALRGALASKTAAAPVVFDTAGVTQAYAQVRLPPSAAAPPPPVHSMFTDPGRGALTRTVNSLWTRGDNAAVAKTAPAGGFDLFSDLPRAPPGPLPGKV